MAQKAAQWVATPPSLSAVLFYPLKLKSVPSRSEGGEEQSHHGINKQTNKMIHVFFLCLTYHSAEGDVPRCSNEDIGSRPFCFPSNYNKVEFGYL